MKRLVTFIFLTSILSWNSLAQEAQVQASSESLVKKPRSTSRLMEEVVVTAQKREENLQEVPIAIVAYSQDKLDAMGIESVQDLERISPGLTITNAAGFNVAYLRGIGTDAFLPGADSSVPFYLDGVPLLGSQGSSDALGRVERTEVLKGPQGTLFGRNATGGAINIVTPSPEEEFYGDIKLELASDNEQNILAFLNIPIIDGLAATVSAYNMEHDNYYENINPDGPELLDIYSKGARAKIRWDVSDTFSLMLTGSVNEGSNNAGLNFENTRPAGAFAAVIEADPKRDRKVSLDQLPGAEVESSLFSFTAEWALPWFDTKLILSDQELDAFFVAADFDGSATPLVSFISKKQVSLQETAELQIISNENSPFSEHIEWVGGVFYLESSGGFDPLGFNVTATALPDAVGDVLDLVGVDLDTSITLFTGGVLVSESLAYYLQGTWFATDTIDFTAGVRYQEEERDLEKSRVTLGDQNNNEGTIIREDADEDTPLLTSHQLSPKFALQWRPLGDEIQFYASASRAYKSPTYNTVGLLETPGSVEEERVDSYELGAKMELLGGALRLNTAAFYIDQKNLLTGFVALASGGIVTYDNAGSSEVSGAELDFLWSPMPNLNPGLVLSGAVTYLNTKYTDYKDGRGFDEETGNAFGEGSLTQDPQRDFTGNEIVRSPEWTGSLGINQAFSLGDFGSLELGGDVYYNSGFFFLPQNSDLYAREEYAVFNARVSYFYDPWGLQVTAFGENITDVEYNENVFVADFGRNEVLNSPVVTGLRVKLSF